MTLDIYFFTNEATSHLHSSTTACYNANIMIFQQICNDFPYFLVPESIKIKKNNFFFKILDKNGQKRTKTDEANFLCRIFTPSKVKDAAESFPQRHPQNVFAPLISRKGKEGNLWGKQTDLIVISNLHQLISNKAAGINPILLSPAQQERCEDVKVLRCEDVH